MYWPSQTGPPVKDLAWQALAATVADKLPVADQAGRPLCHLPVMISH